MTADPKPQTTNLSAEKPYPPCPEPTPESRSDVGCYYVSNSKRVQCWCAGADEQR